MLDFIPNPWWEVYYLPNIRLETGMKPMKGSLPNFLIIGAGKCGTTSLNYYLGLHPEISMSREKELNFFTGELNWGKGPDWYKSNFRDVGKIQEDLYRDRIKELHKVFRFLKVDEKFISPNFEIIKHKSNRKRRKSRLGLLLKNLFEVTLARLFTLDMRIKIGWFFSLPFSRSIERPTLDSGLRMALIDCLKEDTGRLRKFTGLDFRGWCV